MTSTREFGADPTSDLPNTDTLCDLNTLFGSVVVERCTKEGLFVDTDLVI